MKKKYEAPVAEKIEFCYRDQVVASTGCKHTNTSDFIEGAICTDESSATREAS